ncbi:MAG: sulfite exporter TauE/SafE family protein [Solirubrobacterales bacterium]
MEYVALATWCFTVALLGGFVGLVLGNLRLPLVVALASSPATGAGANIGISAVAAATASTAHIRAGRVNWRLFAWMAPPSIVGAVVGGYLSGAIPGDALLFGIAAVLAYSAFQLLRPRGKKEAEEAERAAAGGEQRLDLRAAVLSGAAIGLVGGMVGLILGSLRMPALLRLVGEAPAKAVGTNVTVGLCVGIAGVLGHLPSGAPDWNLLAVGAAASIPGALIGSRLTGRLSEESLLRAIGWVLVLAALSTVVEAVT